MSEELEAMGTAVEGGLIAKAVEDKGIDASRGKGGTCLNCHSAVTSRYCTECGQSLHVHRSIGAFWHDILHGVLHFEGKFWRTLPLLVWKPGDLTRRYVRGERAKFISPMALFLFSVFMMFAVFSFIENPFSSEGDGSENVGFNTAVTAESQEIEKRLQDKLKVLESTSGSEEAEVRKQILDLKRNRNVLATMTMSELPYPEAGLGDDTAAIGNFALDDGPASATEAGADGESLASESGNQLELWTDLEKSAFGKTLKSGIARATKNPSLLLYKLKANGYKFAWLLIPISIPFVWLALIGRRGHHFYDHAVFATYSIAFMSLLFVACAILAAIGAPESIWAAMLLIYPPFHIYRQLRHAYEMSRPEALVRVSFLLIFTVISLTLFFIILLALGILG
ncbi:DUF3667 domain-containing protein [Sphingorhabdus sp. SMR4y]|uniref:DUF3667 domain-containing protein n=1 Tax=Sphingorhabdus sp. SMR4y TaxID=2584094 RepID=UPI000B5C8EC8|nr:DUF3667 domain-containing protein [Sphingorhabdus sp. SMR4y]ASK89868.1 hypothetical protein SPHFLASMR4Y_03138 [Sphingorhabdus sp. SMR4y]